MRVLIFPHPHHFKELLLFFLPTDRQKRILTLNPHLNVHRLAILGNFKRKISFRMETQFGSFRILVSFTTSPLALHLLILVPCFIKGRKKKTSLRRSRDQPFYFQKLVLPTHTYLGLEFPSVLIVYIGPNHKRK